MRVSRIYFTFISMAFPILTAPTQLHADDIFVYCSAAFSIEDDLSNVQIEVVHTNMFKSECDGATGNAVYYEMNNCQNALGHDFFSEIRSYSPSDAEILYTDCVAKIEKRDAGRSRADSISAAKREGYIVSSHPFSGY
ncbi:hypothetical protein [Sulfitobacter mediterraneus]|uniref:hypothetical protein n=1 Tax=Sulfitobacter mediterraneus TaxID=83219 RepID=UPI0019397F49|nr:hypothetical protein [Sulfitobacter mediterraneus]MBM1324557.1 hypothetical protein [Sulfitobacter mediterraneus]